jgi:hypothetical protein
MDPGRAWRNFHERYLAADTRWNQRWIGWVLGITVGLLLVFLLASLVLLVVLVDSFAHHGAGSLGGKAEFTPGDCFDMGPGLFMARLWLCSLLSVLPITFGWLWLLYSKGQRPLAGHRDLDAAQRGEPGAAHRVGLHYRDRDPSAARHWLARAAQAGEPAAMVDLARALRDGRGGPRDLASARGWLHRARVAGAPGAAEELAEVEAQLGDRFSEKGC